MGSSQAQDKMPLVDISDVALAELDATDDSALLQALRRLSRESGMKSDGISAHTSTTHNSSFSQGTW
ncbi:MULTISPECIES: FxSxx-COOH cyclophane-containing RiPP peptide [Pseudofrankia]|uniref:FxSxx-COOH cyclophane-containing RiPP peptide n=1 Tax=Pseudofrankia TaxID=2994363 RepID=UPI00048508E3|nr:MULTISPECIES: FxSxx-COOH cyclophane-containing RiPP peptide [Pseudofrankia]OHV37117.1 FXSXX-COOH protein [Pseudofrankia sp. EUN1h]